MKGKHSELTQHLKFVVKQHDSIVDDYEKLEDEIEHYKRECDSLFVTNSNLKNGILIYNTEHPKVLRERRSWKFSK